jgi:hypothetical protein
MSAVPLDRLILTLKKCGGREGLRLAYLIYRDDSICPYEQDHGMIVQGK